MRNFSEYEGASKKQILEETDLLSIKERLTLTSMIFTWKLLKFGSTISHFQDPFHIMDQDRSSISSTTIVVNPHNTSSYERSFLFSPVSQWNKLERSVRRLYTPFAKFKEKLLVSFIKKRAEVFV